mgnify:CR=1 FL=1
MKNLIFHNAADDSYMNTVENFRGAFASTQTVDIYFQAAGAGVASPGAFDKITVACTNGEEDRAVEQLAGVMAGGSNPVTVVADDVNSVYACQDIISVTTIALAGIGQTFRVPTESVTVNDTLLASESGKTFVFADAGAVLTLPDSGGGDIIGTTYKFISNFTGTAQEVICADTTNEFFIGTILGADQDADASPLGWNAQVSDGFSSIEFTGVTDGKIGSYFTVTNYAADRWLIEGVVAQSGGSEATPFAAS